MLDFMEKEVVHEVEAKFAVNHLPTAKPDAPYVVRPCEQTTLTLEELAAKAPVYGIDIEPDVMKRVLGAGFELIMYLVADNYRVETPFFNVRNVFPGAYTGKETGLRHDCPAAPRISINKRFKKYIADKVKVRFTGTIDEEAWISGLRDVETGKTDGTITPGKNIVISGNKIKVRGDGMDIGVIISTNSDTIRINKERLVTNTPTEVIVLLPDLAEGEYKLVISTAYTDGGKYLKEPRKIIYDKTLTVIRT